MKNLVNNFKHIAVNLGLKKSDNVYIISYPKSGRTWLKVLLGKSLCEHYNLDAGLIFDTTALSHQANCLRTVFTHDGSGFGEKVSWQNLIKDRSNYATQRIIFLTRQPEDTVVSAYFHLSQRDKRFNGSISELIRDDRWGIHKILYFHKIWFYNRNTPYKFLWISYEEMHKDPHKVLKSVLEFMGAKAIPDDVMKKAIEFAQFERLKKMEASGTFNEKGLELRTLDAKNNQSYKVREGKVNGYLNYLSTEDIQYIEEAKRKLGNPFYS